jgi:hypothetical protein
MRATAHSRHNSFDVRGYKVERNGDVHEVKRARELPRNEDVGLLGDAFFGEVTAYSADSAVPEKIGEFETTLPTRPDHARITNIT